MPRRVFVIGASAGGTEALTRLVPLLPAELPAPVLITVHTGALPSMLPQILSRVGSLPAEHAIDGEPVEAGRILLAPPDHHLTISDGRVRVARGPRENGQRPAIDPLFRSAANAYRTAVVGIVLTGLLDDGTAGLVAIKLRGGVAIVQDPMEAAFPAMPQNALDYVNVDHCAPLQAIGGLIVRLAHESVREARPVPREPAADASGRVDPPLRKAPSVFRCPECGGAIWELQDGGMPQFACHEGHAYSPQSFAAADTDGVEEAVWSAVSALDESAALDRRLADHAAERANERMAQRLLRSAKRKESSVDVLRELITRARLDKESEPSDREPTHK